MTCLQSSSAEQAASTQPAASLQNLSREPAATKAAALWSMVNFSEGYPAFVDGRIHDGAGTTAMLLTHAGMDAAGFGDFGTLTSCA